MRDAFASELNRKGSRYYRAQVGGRAFSGQVKDASTFLSPFKLPINAHGFLIQRPS
jgi:hypothetical protein